jgi:hypothetical protein
MPLSLSQSIGECAVPSDHLVNSTEPVHVGTFTSVRRRTDARRPAGLEWFGLDAANSLLGAASDENPRNATLILWSAFVLYQ